MRSSFLVGFILLLFTFPASASSEEFSDSKWIDSDRIILQGLDKVTARVFTAEVRKNQQIHFGSLIVYVRAAKKAAPEEMPESACFLEIFEQKPGEKRHLVYTGWMFASNPALNPLDHAVYDIWIQDVVVPVEQWDPPIEEDVADETSEPMESVLASAE
ncbi:MAG: DUF2155 domain-containing protein [Alphaproteobacteria bacterium]